MERTVIDRMEMSQSGLGESVHGLGESVSEWWLSGLDRTRNRRLKDLTSHRVTRQVESQVVGFLEVMNSASHQADSTSRVNLEG